MADLSDQGPLVDDRVGAVASRPLRLYWWNGKPNFGDRLSADIVAHVSGRPVEWAAPAEAELFALGSILDHVRQALKSDEAPAYKPWIWGSGVMAPMRTDFLDNVRMAAVRGPLSVTLLGLPDLAQGDPGMLAADTLGARPERDDRIGLVLHLSQRLSPDMAERIKADGRFRVIDVRHRDHMQVVAAIGSCRHVISSSLHGLIVADSFGVPNTWLDSTGIHKCAALKFHDYAISVGRIMGRPIPIEAIFDLADALPAQGPTRGDDLPYADDLARAAAGLRAAFPTELTAARAEVAA